MRPSRSGPAARELAAAHMRAVPAAMRAVLAAVALLPCARGQLNSPMPELDPVRWYNTPPLSIEKLRGKVIQIECFRTYLGRCSDKVAALNARFEKEGPKGFVLIAITTEQVEVVDAWVARFKPAYPVAVLKSRELEGAMGVIDWPTPAVIDTRGVLVHSGEPAEVAVKEALGKAVKGPLFPRRFERALQLLRTGDKPGAWAAVEKERGAKLGEVDRQAAESLAPWLAAEIARDVKEARASFEKGLVLDALRAVKGCAKARPPTPSSPAAAELLAEIEALPLYKTELLAGEELEQARELHYRGEFLAAVERYREVMNKFPKCRTAAAAREIAAKLIADGLPGFDGSCAACTKDSKACSKHKVDVQL